MVSFFSQERASQALILKAETGDVSVLCPQCDGCWSSARHVSIVGQLVEHSSTAVIGGGPGGGTAGQWRAWSLQGPSRNTDP